MERALHNALGMQRALGLLLVLTACGVDPEADTTSPAIVILPRPPILTGALREVLPASQGLTLARFEAGGRVHTLGVIADDGDRIEAVNLSEIFDFYPPFPLELVNQLGFQTLSDAIAVAPTFTVHQATLLPPVDEAEHQVAAAENYPEHAEETAVGLPSSPFLFPKIARPSGAVGEVPRKNGDLLDYEVELCVVIDRDIEAAADLEPAVVGFFVCNDFSERSFQVAKADLLNPSAASGFTESKSFSGALPLGPYLVVPFDRGWFLSQVDLRLSLNGVVRQEDQPLSMSWDLSEIVAQALALGAEPRFEFHGRSVALLPAGRIEKGTIILTGTPAGVILKSPSMEFILGAMLEFLGNLSLQNLDPQRYIAREYLEYLRANDEFLHSGDRVVAEGRFLGAQRSTVAH